MNNIDLKNLGLELKQDIKNLEHNGVNIEIKQYLPISEKLDLISWIVNNSQEIGINYINWPRVNLFIALGLVKYYTNITIEEEEEFKTIFDLLINTKLYHQIIELIPADEVAIIEEQSRTMIKEIKDYQNSILGILEAISNDYSNLSYDVEELVKKLQNPESLGLLKDVVTKLG